MCRGIPSRITRRFCPIGITKSGKRTRQGNVHIDDKVTGRRVEVLEGRRGVTQPLCCLPVGERIRSAKPRGEVFANAVFTVRGMGDEEVVRDQIQRAWLARDHVGGAPVDESKSITIDMLKCDRADEAMVQHEWSLVGAFAIDEARRAKRLN